MAPAFSAQRHVQYRRAHPTYGDWRMNNNIEAFILEGWGEGFMLGALLIMALITIANMRRGVLLHKLILLELLLAMSHGTFCFMAFHGYGWYLSSTAALLYCSYFTHNVVSWLKIRPFFREPQATFSPLTCTLVRWIYLSTLVLTIPPLIFEIFNNFRYFNNMSRLYVQVRPYEPLMRDPWWIFACLVLFHVIRKCYGVNLFKLVRRSPRFGILLAAIILAIIFTIMDILASIIPSLSLTDGINPYWKLALVFKCLTDNIMLDDFKSVLQRLGAMRLDGQTAMMENSMNMTPDAKAGNQHDDGDLEAGDPDRSPERHRTGAFKQQEMQHRMSLSGRLLDDGESLDERGYSRRRQSMAASGIGKIGAKIKRLGDMGHLRHSAEREAQRNMELNKNGSASTGSPSTEKPPAGAAPEANGQQNAESVDFITSAL